jgi:hypothetical protein
MCLHLCLRVNINVRIITRVNSKQLERIKRIESKRGERKVKRLIKGSKERDREKIQCNVEIKEEKCWILASI